MSKPRIAIVPGDPSGIGPELIAKLLNLDGVLDAANIVLVGDGHLWTQGAQQADLPVALTPISEADIAAQDGLHHLEMDTIEVSEIQISTVSEAGGRTSLRCLDKALDLAQAGLVDGVLFAPFNKAAMTSAGLNAEDEHKYMARYLGFDGYHSEINVLDGLMTTRVTSHIGLKDVAANISKDGILKAVNLANDTLRRAGKTRPSIAVAALNPHAGDNGKFGREEIEILEPAIAKAQARQMDVTGPWPSDTVFLKAQRGEVDAVVTMYHDQGQIAIKLLGFERGVTVAGGLPIPVATPAHGTAFDIAGQNKANVSATRQAFDLLVRMAKTHRADREQETTQ
ncbi:4-hydroxythreonine-4-phosphate dehydrogenase PdxA [Phaeobacter inhibens]|uniref:4-hydroxythreonine-4-phosphate dehydrogenase PdxA n=1 Tax=Phaeobacter inhibens TaxID=221822 RepID=UPI00076BB4E7|nr:4-hydroxythreonine-4-phosphate dehydrogenase PdxA [Phaeobacter inhibens]KXF92409.1 4-hydroxythreonine-4-phosphate dehydrogenase [Phaeobacter inhibens]KXF92903.1 4-hydroxythreonine-4-phosphate dehydrogenase [Phaeobacter inhibens]WHP70666.1 4-hydroxythreonine-4-phosphate dehydrogenase PdxA [Phaeobacter inhibens]